MKQLAEMKREINNSWRRQYPIFNNEFESEDLNNEIEDNQHKKQTRPDTHL
jgi:hypothetical protein